MKKKVIILVAIIILLVAWGSMAQEVKLEIESMIAAASKER